MSPTWLIMQTTQTHAGDLHLHVTLSHRRRRSLLLHQRRVWVTLNSPCRSDPKHYSLADWSRIPAAPGRHWQSCLAAAWPLTCWRLSWPPLGRLPLCAFIERPSRRRHRVGADPATVPREDRTSTGNKRLFARILDELQYRTVLRYKFT